MKAKSITGKSVSEIRDALQQLKQEAQTGVATAFVPTLAFVFLSVKQDRKAIASLLNEHDIDIMGATSSGEFVDGSHSNGGIAILLTDMKRSDYAIVFEATKGKVMSEMTRQAADAALARFTDPVFVLCSTFLSAAGEMLDGRALIHGLEAALGSHMQIFGGMAGADGALAGTVVFNGAQETDEGFVLLVINGDAIQITGAAISGWKPLGRIRTVTKLVDGWIYEIDGQPALEMYLRYLGQTLSGEHGQNQAFIEDIGFFHPFLIMDDGDPVLRTPMQVSKEKNAIMLDFPVAEGKQLQFTLPPDFDIVETVLAKAGALKEQHSGNADADALLVFSCLGRLTALGPMAIQENEGLHNIWNAPMAGFFSYGEYGQDPETNYLFHSTTCSWVALKEK